MMIAVGPWPVSECRQSKRANIADHRRLSYYSGCNRSLVPCGITQTQWIVKKHIFGPLFVVRKKKNIHKIINWKGNIRKATSKTPPQKPQEAHAQKNRGTFLTGETSATFLHSEPVRVRVGQIHRRRNRFSPPMAGRSDLNQSNWFFNSNQVVIFKLCQGFQVKCFSDAILVVIFLYLTMNEVWFSHAKPSYELGLVLTGRDNWRLLAVDPTNHLQPFLLSSWTSRTHPKREDTESSSLPSECSTPLPSSFRTCKNHFKENPCVRRIGFLRVWIYSTYSTDSYWLYATTYLHRHHDPIMIVTTYSLRP